MRTRPLWKWIALLPIAIYLAIVARYFTTILATTEYSSDASSAQVIGELYSHRGAGNVYLGNLAWYSTLIFELATKWLPAHRQIWTVGPIVSAFGAIALMAWTAAQVLGRRAAYVTAVLLVCASPAVLSQMFAFDNHMTSWYSLALLAALLSFLELRSDVTRWPALALITVAVGVVAGINMASETLLESAAPASLLIASIATWHMHRSARTAKTIGWIGVTVLTMGLVAHATTAIMHSAHTYPVPLRTTFASSEAISTNFRDWWGSIAVLGNGDFFGKPITFSALLSALCAALILGAVLMMPRLVWRNVKGPRAASRAGEAPATAYLIFWTSSATLLSVAFIFSSVPIGLGTDRYLIGLVFAAAAVVPLIGRRSALARKAVVLAALVFAFTSIKGLLNSSMIIRPTSGPTVEMAREVADAAQKAGATQGFAGYWDAAALTWGSDMRIQVHPFYGCLENRMCTGPVGFMSSWYESRKEERTFLLIDPQRPLSLPEPPPELGRAIVTYHFGTATMYVYAHNIGPYVR